MLSRIFWIGLAGIALIAGMALQDGNSILSWGSRVHSDWHKERDVEASVEQAIERSFEKMEVRDANGRVVDAPAQTKRDMAQAVGELVRAETHLAMTRIGEENAEELQAAQDRRNRARAKVDRLKAEFERLERAPASERDAFREEIRREVQEDVRATVREAVGG